MPSIFVLGATGYIGGSILDRYTKVYTNYEFVALVRSDTGIKAVKRLGNNVTAVKGSHSDHEIITELASKADIILNAADADDLELTKAVLAGARRTTIGKIPILIHTSGTGVATTAQSLGKKDPNYRVLDDSNVEDIKSIPPDAPHRQIDLAIFAADAAGYVSAYIIAPSTIYGTGSGPGNKISQQIPTLIKEILAHKQTVYVGEGTNEWNNVHIEDLVDLYIIVTNLAISELGTKTDPYSKFFWGSVGLHTWGDIARKIGNILYAKGLIDKVEPKSIPFRQELAAIATNSITKATRARNLEPNSWKPKHGPGKGVSIEASLEETIDQVVAGSK
ncbi:hypothetical protein M408DRAFT_67513 [Serendipita vermifera MAFF 305830]|uniref:NAD-dependent epimerase/dehydratase domain-containing protein n=1 Tax=Serendipita vermifera MAFF 305830 TaxID=933852 RepID=A0A0C3BC49_SERVB|nr:hypothetical protein M408DRAFT_67513 [Serendipita vermifera MAFF 305830]